MPPNCKHCPNVDNDHKHVSCQSKGLAKHRSSENTSIHFQQSTSPWQAPPGSVFCCPIFKSKTHLMMGHLQISPAGLSSLQMSYIDLTTWQVNNPNNGPSVYNKENITRFVTVLLLVTEGWYLTKPPLVKIMACLLVGAKPLSEPMLKYC